jgi:hypothetical protein
MNGTTTTDVLTDADRIALWAFYVVVNGSGGVWCALLALTIARKKEKTAYEICVLGLFTGCCVMSIPCAIQCALDLVHGSVMLGASCMTEALLHVSAILVQFVSISLIAGAALAMIRMRAWSTLYAKSAVAVTFFVCGVVTWGLGVLSDVAPLPAGVYCFPRFDSVIVQWWFVPMFSVTLVVTIVTYTRLWWQVRASGFAVQRFGRACAPCDAFLISCPGRVEVQSVHRATGLRAMLFLVVYVAGWLPVLVAYCYNLAHGEITWRLDVALGVCGSLHSWWVPLTYDVLSRRNRLCTKRSSYETPHSAATTPSPRGAPRSTSPRPDVWRSPRPRMNTPPLPTSSRSATPPLVQAYVFQITSPPPVSLPLSPSIVPSPMSTSRISTLQLPSTTRSPHRNEHVLRVDG